MIITVIFFTFIATVSIIDCNLDTLLVQVRSEVIPKWHELGLAIGMDSSDLNKLLKYPSEQCMIEVLDWWIRSHDYLLTWKEVARILQKMGFHSLSENILNVYITGKK